MYTNKNDKQCFEKRGLHAPSESTWEQLPFIAMMFTMIMKKNNLLMINKILIKPNLVSINRFILAKRILQATLESHQVGMDALLHSWLVRSKPCINLKVISFTTVSNARSNLYQDGPPGKLVSLTQSGIYICPGRVQWVECSQTRTCKLVISPSMLWKICHPALNIEWKPVRSLTAARSKSQSVLARACHTPNSCSASDHQQTLHQNQKQHLLRCHQLC